MPHVSNLRLFFPANCFQSLHRFPFSAAAILAPGTASSSFSSPFILRSFSKRRKSHFLLAASCSDSRKPNRALESKGKSRFFKRRGSSVPEKGAEKENYSDKGDFLGMEERDGKAIDAAEFNRKRAEGRDDDDRPRRDLQLKVRKLNPASTISYVQILGTGMDTQDTSPSVLLFFDNQRFIFNAGEGLQRFCSEHKIKLSKINHIFLSRVCSETAGGLPGLLLTLAGMGEKGMSVNVWGPLDLKYFVDAMRSFIPNAAMVHTHSFGTVSGSNGAPSAVPGNQSVPLVLVEDEVVKISALFLKPRRVPLPEPADVDVTKPGDVSVVYICELPEIKGKFDRDKAVALDLRPGPKYRELQLGKSVKSDSNGKMVHPHDVLEPSVPGPIVLIVDCPTTSHVHDLVSLECLKPYYIDTGYEVPEGSKHVHCLIHLSPSCVSRTDEYRNWMSEFGAAQHIMAGHEMKNIEIPILKSSARIAARLNYLCPQFFPSPGIWSLENHNGLPGRAPSPRQNLLREGAVTPAENLLKFHLRPYASLGLDASCVPSKLSSSEVVDELLSEIPEIGDARQRVDGLWSENGASSTSDSETSMHEEPWLPETSLPSCLNNVTREDMEIVLLGTGSSQPSKHRNVSAILINLFSKGSILLDCGEGNLGQLKRRYGVEGADEIIRGLKCIWISHIHADHHTGLARILALRSGLLRGKPHEPVVVVGPRQLKRYLDAYQRLEDLDMQFLDCAFTTEASLESLQEAAETGVDCDSEVFAGGGRMQSFTMRPHSPAVMAAVLPVYRSLKRALEEAGLEALISFPVVHCPQAFGVVLQAENRGGLAGPGWKLVYSGDTRPCLELVRASRGATVLIHEATFEDGMVEEAVARNHSTTKEAVEAGDAAGAYRTILTHFSQRYPKIPVFDEAYMHKTCVAFDMMSVNLADIHLLPRVLPYLKLLFRDEMAPDGEEGVLEEMSA